LLLLGLFGVAFAISGLLAGLPRPAAGGTCGPGASSESSIVALLDPVSIGAGPEPATTHATDRADWMAFVGECQASADSRVLATFAIFVLSVGVAVVGSALLMRKRPETMAPSQPANDGPSLTSFTFAPIPDSFRSPPPAL
jgi:hypothetical protein